MHACTHARTQVRSEMLLTPHSLKVVLTKLLKQILLIVYTTLNV